MTIKFNTTGKERKRLAQAIATHLERELIYKKAPTFAYEVDYFTIDRNGSLIFDDRADSEEIENLIEFLVSQGFEFEAAEELPTAEVDEVESEEAEADPAEDEEDEDEPIVTESEDGVSLTITIAIDTDDSSTADKLVAIIDSKATLFKHALGVEDLTIERTEEGIAFPWFSATATPQEVYAYAQFLTALVGMAKNQKRVTAKVREIENEKYAFRCFLLRLKLIGEEYKESRKILLSKLTGSSAFKTVKEAE